MKYKVAFSEEGKKSFKKLPPDVATNIAKKLSNYLASSPAELGKKLTGSFSGLYRYLIGDYRIIYQFDVEKFEIIIRVVGHRKSIYDK